MLHYLNIVSLYLFILQFPVKLPRVIQNISIFSQCYKVQLPLVLLRRRQYLQLYIVQQLACIANCPTRTTWNQLPRKHPHPYIPRCTGKATLYLSLNKHRPTTPYPTRTDLSTNSHVRQSETHSAMSEWVYSETYQSLFPTTLRSESDSVLSACTLLAGSACAVSLSSVVVEHRRSLHSLFFQINSRSPVIPVAI